jgi:phage-related protein
MLRVVFFRTEGGSEPVLDFLRALEPEERRIVGEDLRTVQIGWPLGMPLCRRLEKGLYEIRSDFSAKRQICRLIFFQHGDALVIVEGFIKKAQKTPEAALQQARKRRNEFERNAKSVKH